MDHHADDELMVSIQLVNQGRADRGALPIPLPHPGGLVAWAHDPIATPNPLPPIEGRRTRSLGWPVGLLPVRHLAADLSARGLTYRQAVGFAINGDKVHPLRAAHLLADVLEDAAEVLPDPLLATLRVDTEPTVEERVDARLLALDAQSAGLIPDGVTPGEYERWLLPRGYAPHTLAALRDAATPAHVAEDTLETVAERRQIRFALRHTATDLRTSRAAQRSAMALIAAYLPDGNPALDAGAATDFLAHYDSEPTVRRSALVAAYEAAGAPGSLTRAGLLHLATERWRRPVKSSGHFTYRPSSRPGTHP